MKFRSVLCSQKNNIINLHDQCPYACCIWQRSRLGSGGLKPTQNMITTHLMSILEMVRWADCAACAPVNPNDTFYTEHQHESGFSCCRCFSVFITDQADHNSCINCGAVLLLKLSYWYGLKRWNLFSEFLFLINWNQSHENCLILDWTEHISLNLEIWRSWLRERWKKCSVKCFSNKCWSTCKNTTQKGNKLLYTEHNSI